MNPCELQSTSSGVEYTCDPNSRDCTFVVPRLHIIGGAETREQAVRSAVDAIVYTLETEIGDDEVLPDTEAERIRATVG